MAMSSMAMTVTMDTAQATRGFRTLSDGFKDVTKYAKMFKSDLVRLTEFGAKFAKTLALIGIGAASGLLLLASKSPVLAGVFAKMQVELFKLGNTLGQIVKPIFEVLSNDLIPAFNEALQNWMPQIEKFTNAMVQGGTDLSNLLRGDLNQIEGLIEKGSMTAIGAAVGFALLGPSGLFIGAALGYIAGETTVQALKPKSTDTPRQAEEKQTTQALFGRGPLAGAESYGLYYDYNSGGFEYGGGTAGFIRKLVDFITQTDGRQNQKEISYSLNNGVSKGVGVPE